jgi:hypothetical protein
MIFASTVVFIVVFAFQARMVYCFGYVMKLHGGATPRAHRLKRSAVCAHVLLNAILLMPPNQLYQSGGGLAVLVVMNALVVINFLLMYVKGVSRAESLFRG